MMLEPTAEKSLTGEIVSALADAEILHSNVLATVTRNCVIIPNSEGHAQTMISLDRIVSVRRIKSTYPGLLVIAGGLGLIAAAAACSKDGHAAALPIALLGLGFAVAYLGTRRGSVAIVVGFERRDVVETAGGTLKEASAIIRAISTGRPVDRSQAA